METKSFISSLFDFTFTSYVTPKFLKFLFVVGIIVAILATIVAIITGFMSHIAIGVIVLILSPIIFFLYVLFVRIYIELVMILFRIQADVAKLVEQKEQQ